MRRLGLLSLLFLWATAGLAQQPRWANGKVFRLDEVEISVRYPAGGLSGFPGYAITVKGDGSLLLRENTAHGELVRRLNKQLDRQTIYSLLDQFLQIQFFDLPSTYGGGAKAVPEPYNPSVPLPETFRIRPDHTTQDGTFVELRLKIGNQVKMVTNWNREGPPQLEAIAKKIDELAGTDKMFP